MRLAVIRSDPDAARYLVVDRLLGRKRLIWFRPIGAALENRDQTEKPDDNTVIPKASRRNDGSLEFEVGTVEEAVRLAETLKADGRYQYFRGQRDASWPVVSSFARANETEREIANSVVRELIDWIREAGDPLRSLQDDDMIIAAVQHYQIAPTTFIDFSLEPEIAGWFAVDGAQAEGIGAIYMVNSKEVAEVFALISNGGLFMKFRELDVPNLWHLQVQAGLFLEAQCDVSQVWPLDRIVFKHTGGLPSISRENIYPNDRSYLRQQIDKFLEFREKQRGFREIVDTAELGGAAIIKIEHPLAGSMPKLDRTGLPAEWFIAPNERWTQLDANSTPPIWSVRKIAQNTASLCELVVRRRSSASLLKFRCKGFVNCAAQEALDRLWEGMRLQPYTAEQVSQAVQSLVRLNKIFENYPFGDGNSFLSIAQKVMSAPVELEMGLTDGTVTRDFVPSLDLLNAVKEQARGELRLNSSMHGESLMDALGPYFGATLHIFDPSALVGLFAATIIPWQVVTRRSPICFSPFHLETLGRP